MANLSISNFINVSVAQVGATLGPFNTSNLAIFTRDTFASSFGTLGYSVYNGPAQVGVDFGTNSATFKMATAVFSQSPNILTGGGSLVVFPMLTSAQVAVQNINFPTVPTAGAFVLNYGSHATSSLAFNATAATIQTALQALTGLATVTVSGSIASQNLNVTFTGVSGPATLLTVTSNTLVDANTATVTPVVTTTTIGASSETFDAAIVRTAGLAPYFGCMIAELTSQAVMLAAAAVIQSLTKLAFFVSNNAADVATGGLLDLLRSGSFSQSRGLFYQDTVVANCLNYMAAYAGRALSVDYTGSNTTLDMNLKQLATIQPDPNTTQTVNNLAFAAGADTYCSYDGLVKVRGSGANVFFDRIQNQLWFSSAIITSYFNTLASSNTKIPQTEAGMGTIKAGLTQVCEQAVTNQYSAPGTWTDPNTFGNLSDFLSNISQRGYYIFSTPIATQLAAARNVRAAPLIQIALKEAGAIDKGNVIININP